MKVAVTLAGSLADRIPADADSTTIELDLPDDATPVTVIEQLALPPEETYLVSVNGTLVPAARRPGHALSEGDAVTLMPPLKGG